MKIPFLSDCLNIGVEVGLNTIKVASVLKQKRKMMITGLATASLTGGALVLEELVSTLEQLFNGFNYQRAKVVASLPAAKLISRVIKVPVMNEQELATAMFYEAQGMLPQGLEEWVIRHTVLNTAPNQKGQIPVLLIAVPRQLVLLLHQAFTNAKIKLAVLDIPYFGLWRFNLSLLAKLNNVVMYIAQDNTLLLMVKDKIIYQLHQLPLGYEHIHQQGVDFFAREIDNFWGTYHQQLVEQLIITGHAPDIGLLLPGLSKRLALPVIMGKTQLPLAAGLTHTPAELSSYAIAVGLALEGGKLDEIPS